MQETATVQLAANDSDSVVCFCLFQLTGRPRSDRRKETNLHCVKCRSNKGAKEKSGRGVQRINSLTLFIYF